jgi:hypothetical protein
LSLDKVTLSDLSLYLYEEYLKNSDKYKSVSYFRRSPGGKLIMFKIMNYYFSTKDLCVEELIRKVPINVASRLSLFTLIDTAVKKGILIKKPSKSGDKRKKCVEPSDNFVKEYKDWLQHYINEIKS